MVTKDQLLAVARSARSSATEVLFRACLGDSGLVTFSVWKQGSIPIAEGVLNVAVDAGPTSMQVMSFFKDDLITITLTLETFGSSVILKVMSVRTREDPAAARLGVRHEFIVESLAQMDPLVMAMILAAEITDQVMMVQTMEAGVDLGTEVKG